MSSLQDMNSRPYVLLRSKRAVKISFLHGVHLYITKYFGDNAEIIHGLLGLFLGQSFGAVIKCIAWKLLCVPFEIS
jgi:hypothetical protein